MTYRDQSEFEGDSSTVKLRPDVYSSGLEEAPVLQEPIDPDDPEILKQKIFDNSLFSAQESLKHLQKSLKYFGIRNSIMEYEELLQGLTDYVRHVEDIQPRRF